MSNVACAPKTLVLRRSAGFYRIPFLQAYGLEAFFTTKEVASARKTSALFKKAGLVWESRIDLRQVHGGGVVIGEGAGQARQKSGPPLSFTADAVITDRPRRPLCVRSADCLSIFFFDPGKRVIALVHAGWRGLREKVIAATLKKMCSSFSSQRKDILAVFGPSIRSCCYEVGQEFLHIFAKEFCVSRGGRLFFDLAASAAAQLKDEGLSCDRISDSYICVSCMNREFSSFRKEGDAAGRSLSVFAIF